MHVVAETKSTVHRTKEKTKIAGVLATPRISRNNTLYFPEELAKQHGKIIPVDIEHNHEHTIGFAKLIWNQELQRLEYVGEISDHAMESQLKDGVEYHTSLEGACESQEVCSASACHTACVSHMNIERMGLVLEPGIPETTVTVTESNSSLVQKPDFKKPLSTITKEEDKCVCKDDKTEAKEFAVTPEIESKLSSLGWYRPKKETAVAVVDPDSSLGKKASEVAVQAAYKAEERREHYPVVGKQELELVVNPIISELKEMNRALGERGREIAKAQPIAEVAQPSVQAIREGFSKFKEFKEFMDNRSVIATQWSIDKSKWLKEHGYDAKHGTFTANKSVKETVTATNVPAITFQNRIILDPTDITRFAARSACNVMEAGQGTDLINWYTGDAASAGFEAQTVGTAFTDRTLTITRQQAQLSKRVMGIKVSYYDVHDIPGGVLEAANEAMTLRAIDDENAFVVGTGSGGFSESGFTPTNWIQGNDGSVITAENLAAKTMKREGIVHAKRLIAAQGFDVSPGAQVAILHPQPYAELLLDTNLNNYYQYARPEITTSAVLETIYGTDVAVSTAIPFNDDTNDMHRNVMLTKGITSGLGADAGLEFEADRRNDVAQIFLSARHRVVGKRILENSGCRISTTKS